MYRGPGARRVGTQFSDVQAWAGQPVTWRKYVSASSGTTSGYFAGGGTTRYYQERTITALFAAPQMGESRFRETPLPGGEVVAGDAVVSTPQAMSQADELIWNGVTYRIASDTTPIRLNGDQWYRTVIRRGDATG